MLKGLETHQLKNHSQELVLQYLKVSSWIQSFISLNLFVVLR